MSLVLVAEADAVSFSVVTALGGGAGVSSVVLRSRGSGGGADCGPCRVGTPFVRRFV